MIDPLATVRRALDAHGCAPAGPIHKLTARCPAHEDRSPSLSIAEGADGRALVCCHAGCEPGAVIAALGLSWADLFPAGHRHARRARTERPELAGNALRVANTLAALDAAGLGWHAMVTCQCPYCGSPGAWLRASPNGMAHVDCPNGCGTSAFAQALAGRVALARSGARHG